MKYAIVKTGANQVKVAEGDIIKILGKDSKPNFEVIFFSDNGVSVSDKVTLKDVKITAVPQNSARGRKVRVGRFKSKSRYDKTRGYRDEFTNVLISKISFGKESQPEVSDEKAEKPAKKQVTTKKPVASAKTARKDSSVKKTVTKAPSKKIVKKEK